MALIGCKHDEEIKKEEPKPLGPVYAGVLGENMVYNDFEPDIDIDTLPLVSYPNYNINSKQIDLNNDNLNDCEIYVRSSSINYYIGLRPLNSQENKVSYCCTNVNCTRAWSGPNCRPCLGDILSFEIQNKVNNDSMPWSNTKLYDDNGFVLCNENYKYKRFEVSDTALWSIAPNQYIGFKFIEGVDTLYGWMRVSIVGKAHIVVHDCAYQKR